MDVKNLIVGVDLNRRESQICYYERGTQEAVSAPVQVGSARSAFPTLLSWIPKTREWHYGIEAEFFAEKKNGILLDQIYDLCADGNSVSLEEDQYSGGELLAIFLKLALTMVGVTEPARQVDGIMITVPALTRPFVQAIRQAYDKLGIARGRAYLQDYKESFYTYTLYQKQELWSRKVGLFLFREEGELHVGFQSLSVNTRTKPATVSVTEGQTIRLGGDGKQKDQQFCALIRDSLKEDLYSSIYLLGSAFDETWAVHSTALLCRGQRRVFCGDNLFAKGACFAAREKVEERLLKGYLYLGSDLIRYNLGMEMRINGSPAYYPLVTAGVNWYETEKECEFLLDQEEELVFVVSDMEEGKRRRYSMSLPDLPQRPPKTTRLRLHVEYDSPRRCQIDVEDLGFGELFPSSGRSWHETMEEK